MIDSVGSPGLWVGFTAFIVGLLVLDLGVFHRRAHEVGFREAVSWVVVWVSLALAFNVLVYRWFGTDAALAFLTGYLIEEALSVDNIFVFLVLFSYFAVPRAYQHRVLFWGILGALMMRFMAIAVGSALLHAFHPVIYLFGGLLLVTGYKMLRAGDLEVQPERNPVYRVFTRFVRAVTEYRGARFFVLENGRWYATPLLFVLVAIECTDLVFAVDSIPAIFAVTQDPFIVYTSNIFAILGLRAMFFALSGAMATFEHLKVGLAAVLMFVGVKMLMSDVYKISIGVSLALVAALIGASIVSSLITARRLARQPSALGRNDAAGAGDAP